MESAFWAEVEAHAKEDIEDQHGTAGDTHKFDCPKLVPDVVGGTLLVELDDVHDSLGILLLLLARYAAFLEQLLPFLWQAGELTGGRVKADVGEMDWIVRRADLWASAGCKDLRHEAEDALSGLYCGGRAAGTRLGRGLLNDGLPA